MEAAHFSPLVPVTPAGGPVAVFPRPLLWHLSEGSGAEPLASPLAWLGHWADMLAAYVPAPPHCGQSSLVRPHQALQVREQPRDGGSLGVGGLLPHALTTSRAGGREADISGMAGVTGASRRDRPQGQRPPWSQQLTQQRFHLRAVTGQPQGGRSSTAAGVCMPDPDQWKQEEAEPAGAALVLLELGRALSLSLGAGLTATPFPVTLGVPL